MDPVRVERLPPSRSLRDQVGVVWLLEDSAVDTEHVRSALPDHAFRSFTDGAALLEELSQSAPPDVLVLDWELPTMSGLEVCKFVRRSHDQLALPIIMLTGHRDESSLVEAFAAGANDYLAKPYARPELQARVRAAIGTRRTHASLVETLAALESQRARVAESEAKYRRLAEAGVIGIIETDLRGRVLDANDAFLRLVKLKRADLAAGKLSAVLENGPIDHRAVRELLDTGNALPFEKELIAADGSLVTVRVAATRLGTRTDRCVGYVLDVTNERRVEADRARLFAAEQRARADAELASRMKDEFLAIVSHELRTPLNAVLGWASILETTLPPTEQSTKALEVIQRNARLQAKMIDDILDVSRIVSGKVMLEPRDADLDAIAAQAIEATRPAADAKGIAIVRELAQPMPPVHLDPDRIQQVVWNLLTNAVKFTDRGGSVVVTTRLERGWAVIEVRDTGAGIAPENLSTIFERFRQIDATTKRSHGGLGLGLAIVRHLVEQHGGTVRAMSEGLGRGSTMTVRLPVAGWMPEAKASSATPARTHAAAPEGPLPSLVGCVVLVLDDDDDSRAFAASALRAAGAELIACSNVDDALAAITVRPPDVALSDIAMPDQDGFDFVRRVRALPATEGGGIPCIALTAHAREHDIARVLAAGFQQHVAKPIESAALVRAVASCRGLNRSRSG
jgi:PAS domain S-box-containing protein